jgi:hypothetical protein
MADSSTIADLPQSFGEGTDSGATDTPEVNESYYGKGELEQIEGTANESEVSKVSCRKRLWPEA